MSKLYTSPRGVYYITRTIYNNTTSISHCISYSSYRGFTLSADSLEALLTLVDWFWCPSNLAGITSINELNRAIVNSLEDTIEIDLAKVG